MFRSLLWVWLAIVWLPSYGQSPLAELLREDPPPRQRTSTLLVNVLEKLEKQYQTRFSYDQELLQHKRVTDTEVSQTKDNLETVLIRILKPLQLTFEQFDQNTYVIYPETKQKSLRKVKKQSMLNDTPIVFPAVLIPQSKASVQTYRTAVEQTISGQVTDLSTGESLPGVNILAQGTTTGTVTDVEGNYRLTVSDDVTTLVFSSIGYETVEESISGRSTINLALSPDIQSLSEVVVIGYGSQKKSDVTGSVSSVEPKDFENEPIANVTQGLQGKVAGVNVTSGSGAPGGNMIVRIRGNNSVIGSNDPLYVVDGVPIQGGNNGSTNLLSTLNPGDIASIEVLKDASATAIYGSRGSNGVILITTKQGKEGGNVIEFETSFGYREIQNQLDMMNSRQFAEIANERNINDGLPIIFDNIDSLAATNTNWQDEIFRKGMIQNHSLRFSGGNDKTRYLISGNYFDENGIIIGSDFQRGSIRLNLDQNVSDKLKVSGRFFVSRSVNNEVDDNAILESALNSPPFFSVYNPDGSYVNAATLKQFSFSPSSGDNAVALAKERMDRRTLDRLLGNVTGSYTLMDGLMLNVMLGVDQVGTKRDYYNPRILESGLPAGSGLKSFGNTTSFLNENTLNYSKDFSNRHSLNVVAGFTWQTEQSEYLTGRSNGFVTDELQNNILGSGENYSAPDNGFNEWTLISWLGRINYVLDDKYLFTLSGRADGSSRFGAGNKWGFFPSGAFAWRVSEEDFIRNNVSGMSNLKLRLSYGLSGNQAISPYQSLQRFTDVSLGFGGTPTSGFAANNLGNPDLRWETTEEFNAGLEIGFWQERIRASVDYYVKNTSDLLAEVNLPPTSGFTTNIQNIGSTRNSGFEIQVGTDLVRNDKITWDLSLNAYRNVNVVTETADGQDIVAPTIDIIGSANIVREGEPLSAFYGLKTDGLTEEGVFNFVDTNGDGEINDNDRVILGSPYSDMFYGMSTNFSYGNLSLRISLVGEAGKTIWNNNKYRHMNSFHRGSNQLAEVADLHWTPENPNPNAPYPKATSGLNQRPSDFYLEDASFLRIQNIQLNYNIPVSSLNQSTIKAANIFMSIQNLYTFTDYSWYTPDVNTFASGDLRIGIDQRTYPSARTFTMGLKISL
uniref:TonB-dependent receptor n=1 Tax=Roseihalotalea indica TaxID=2867963 RepID=A0AA49GI25_9BACT|nr:TonB-dependent receptor [Tunicatimonas sp. TK19036]